MEVQKPRYEDREHDDIAPELLMPQNALPIPERLVGAFAASEAARLWLDDNPESSFGAAPPAEPTHPTKNPEDEVLATVHQLRPRRTEDTVQPEDLPLAA